jgi:hypothetical protein
VRVDQITSVATKTTRLWCLLEVSEDARQEFMRAHSMLSAAVTESCARGIKHLVGLRTQILGHDVRIEQLCSTLGVIRPRAERGYDF